MELGAGSRFMRGLEQRKRGGPLRASVSRPLPNPSAMVVTNRTPHEPRLEGGFARGAGGAVTALLTLAEVTAADWVCCARLEFGENIRKAMTALRNFDVLLVNPVYDGLNLVVKEGALVNRTDGMIVLSENAGAHEELQPHVLSINPFDIEATGEALYEGLVM